MTTTFIAISALILYLIAGIGLAVRLSQGTIGGAHKGKLLNLGLAAAGLHAIVLYQGLFVGGGLNLGFFNALSLLTWLIAMLILLSSYTKPMENLGITLLPLAALAITLDLFFPTEHFLSHREALALEAHILISILAYSMLTVAAGQAILLSVQESHLHRKRPGGFIRALPPLETMETLLFQILTLGFILQSLSLLTGFLFLKDMFAQHLAHKTILSLVAWGVYAALLAGRWRYGWRGRKAIRWTLTGFIVLILAYLGSKLVRELVLGR